MNPPEAVDLPRLAEETVALCASQIADRGAAVSIEPTMPAVWGDRKRLMEVFQNLVDNAVKFTAGEPGLDLLLHPAAAGGRVEHRAGWSKAGVERRAGAW